MDFDGIADAHAEEGSGDLVIECPIGVGGAICELTYDFGRFEIDAYYLWFAIANGGGDLCRVTDDVCAAVIGFLRR